MPLLSRFSPPAHLTEMSAASRETWSELVHVDVEAFAGAHSRFYDPIVTETPVDQEPLPVAWNAFPATLLHGAPSSAARWSAADSSRDRQDEYCEWSVARDESDNIKSVTFTTETPEYFQHLAIAEPDLLLSLYSEALGREVDPAELEDSEGAYDPRNPLNTAANGPIVHLSQGTNFLGAAIRLAAEATDLYFEADGSSVTNQQRLVVCGGLGEPLRNSDPQIASAVNNLSAGGNDITLADPPGLYIDGLLVGNIEAPVDGIDPIEFWHVERGDDLVVRARFEVPSEFGFATSDVKIGGVPLRFGAQLADRVRIKIRVNTRPSTAEPARVTCAPRD